MIRTQLCLMMEPLYDPLYNCPDRLVKDWEGPLLLPGTDYYINTVREMDMLVAVVVKHTVTETNKGTIYIWIEMCLDENAIEHIKEDRIRPVFLENMKAYGWDASKI